MREVALAFHASRATACFFIVPMVQWTRGLLVLGIRVVLCMAL